MVDISDDDLLAELGFKLEPKMQNARTPREERIIAGFEDIIRFREEHGRGPTHREDSDIFERLYAVRLDQLRAQNDCRTLLQEFDRFGLLDASASSEAADDLGDEALLSELGIEPAADVDLTKLKHVKPRAEIRAAEEIANRTACHDFEKFKPLFDQVQKDIEVGTRNTRPFELKAEIRPGAWFIVGGQKAYVADMGEVFTNDQGRTDARLRVIFDNGTESGMLMRSLQRQLNKDDAGRRITDSIAGPLFANQSAEGDIESGTIYVLRSKSDHPVVSENRDLVHKIGVTNTSVEQRIAGARLQATYLLADVEIVASYKLFNLNRSKLEHILHRVLSPARLDLTIQDRFGNPVKPQEWYLVPLHVIDEIVEKVRDGSITEFAYDPTRVELVQH
jgi:hypothetical protein